MSENLENRISSEQAKDAIFKMHSTQSSASEIDNMVINGATKSDLSSLTLESGNMTPEQAATISNLSGKFVPNKNLFDVSKITNGGYVNKAGAVVAHATYSYSDKIYVLPNTAYSMNKVITFYTEFDSSGTVVASSTNGQYFTTSTNASYIIISAKTTTMLSNVQVEKGSSYTLFEPYILKLETDNIKDLDTKILTINSTLGYAVKEIGINKYNPSTNTLDYYLNGSGTLTPSVGYQTSDFIEVKPNTTYKSNKVLTFICSYTADKVFIRKEANNVDTLITPSNAKYVRFSTNQAASLNLLQFEEGDTSTDYEPYRKAIPKSALSLVKDPIVITAGFSGSYNFTGRRAIQDAIDSITDATFDKQYEIIVYDGVYTATVPSEFDMAGVGYSFIQGKDYVNVKAVNRDTCIIIGKLANNLGSGFSYTSYQPVLWNCEATISNFTIYAENCRYPLHIDSNSINKNETQNVINCKLVHIGNSGDYSSSVVSPLGLGTRSGQILNVVDCEVASANMHDNINFTKPSIVTYDRCTITGRADDTFPYVVACTSLGAYYKSKFIFKNCTIATKDPVIISSIPNSTVPLNRQYADRVSIDLDMKEHTPFPIFNSGMNGLGLRVTSLSTSSVSTVRFDSSCTAFTSIISDTTNTISYVNSYTNNTLHGYQYKNGGSGLNGYAIGKLGISEDTTISSLGKRLGDCSITNKTLTIIIDGISYNIVFSTNLTNATNTAILTLINNVIGSVATASVYCVGLDYFPKFKGNAIKTNADTTPILAGMGIVYISAGTIRKATNVDGRIDGIALDNCIVGGTTRIITCGQIYSRNSGQRFSIQQSTNTATTYGTKLGMSAIAGVFEIGATPTLLNGVGANIVEMVK